MAFLKVGRRLFWAAAFVPLAAAGVLLSGCQMALVTSTPTPETGVDNSTGDYFSPDGIAIVGTPSPTQTAIAITSNSISLRVSDDVDPSGTNTPIVGEPFILDGAYSEDDGVIRTFSWRQVDGPFAVVMDTSSPAPAIVPTQAGTYVFEVTVTNPDGSTIQDRADVRVEKFNVKQEFGPTQATRGRFAGGSTIPIHFAAPAGFDASTIEVQFSTDGGQTWQKATPVGVAPDTSAIGIAVPGSVVGPTPTAEQGTASLQSTATPDRIAITATSADDRTAPAAVPPAGTLHTFVWNAQADLGTDAQTVTVRGWDPAKKEPIEGTATVQYDPVIDDASTACGIHPDLWRLNEDTTTIRNEALAQCATRLVQNLVASGALTREQEQGFGNDLDAYDSVVFNPMATGGTADAAFSALTNQITQLQLQDTQQRASQVFQMISSVLKARHDTAMATIQNMR